MQQRTMTSPLSHVLPFPPKLGCNPRMWFTWVVRKGKPNGVMFFPHFLFGTQSKLQQNSCIRGTWVVQCDCAGSLGGGRVLNFARPPPAPRGSLSPHMVSKVSRNFHMPRERKQAISDDTGEELTRGLL